MQPQNSKTHTVLLLVLVLMAGVIIGLLLADSRQKVEAPVVTPVQNPITETEKNVNAQVTPEQESVYDKLVQDNMNNKNQLLNDTKVLFKTYTNKNFSFNYDSRALVTKDAYVSDNGPFYVNIPNGEFAFTDYIKFFASPVPDDDNPCNKNNVNLFSVKVMTKIINGKTFTYCDNTQGEPLRTYIYTKNGKTIVVYVSTEISTTSIKPQSGFIDLGSIEIK